MSDIPDYMRGFDLDEDYGFTPVDAKPKSDTTVDKKVVEDTNLELSKVKSDLTDLNVKTISVSVDGSTTYYWRVKTSDGTNSSFSNIYSFKTE